MELWPGIVKKSIKSQECYVVEIFKDCIDNFIHENTDNSVFDIMNSLKSKTEPCITGLVGRKDIFCIGISMLNIYDSKGKLYVSRDEEHSILVTPLKCKLLSHSVIISGNNIYKIIEDAFNINLKNNKSYENILNKISEGIFNNNNREI